MSARSREGRRSGRTAKSPGKRAQMPDLRQAALGRVTGRSARNIAPMSISAAGSVAATRCPARRPQTMRRKTSEDEEARGRSQSRQGEGDFL